MKTYQKPHPALLRLRFLTTHPSRCIKIEARVGCTVHVYVKGFSQNKKVGMSVEFGVRESRRNAERTDSSWNKKQMEIPSAF